MNMFFKTLREYMASIIFSTLFLLSLPPSDIRPLQEMLIYILTIVPITFTNIIFMNFSSMVIILIFGLINIKFVSFFVVLNGVALGIMISIYRNNIIDLILGLFPHSLIEIFLILIFCTFVKLLFIAYKNKHENIKYYWMMIVCICIPLLLISGYLEVLFFK